MFAQKRQANHVPPVTVCHAPARSCAMRRRRVGHPRACCGRMKHTLDTHFPAVMASLPDLSLPCISRTCHAQAKLRSHAPAPRTLRRPRPAHGPARRRPRRPDRRPRAGPLHDRDVLVIAQKIVSKAEDRIVDLATVTPSARAVALAAEVGKDPRLVEVDPVGIHPRRAQPPQPADHAAPAGLRDGQCRRGPLQRRARRRHRPRAAAAGRPGRLRRAPARRAWRARFGVRLGVIISDSFGRPWRRGTAGVAIGAAGLPVADRPARPARPVRPHPGGHRHRLRRRDRRRRLPAARPGRRGAARWSWCAA